MKKITSLVITGVLAAATIVAAPVAAQAAPKSFDLPSGCLNPFAVDGKIDAESAAAVRADVHPNKGIEYVYGAACFSKDFQSSKEYLVVTDAKGKVVTKQRVSKNSAVIVTDASKKSGVKYAVLTQYKGTTSEWRQHTAKWSTKSKKFTIKKSARPGYIKTVHSLSGQLAKGKKVTAVKASKSNLKKLNTFGKQYKKATYKSASCVPMTSKTGLCVMGYVKGESLRGISFNITKSGKSYKVTSVKNANDLFSLLG